MGERDTGAGQVMLDYDYELQMPNREM